MLVTQSLADGRQTDTAVDQLCGVAVTELMEGAGDPCTLRVGLPADLNTLVADRAAASVLTGLEYRAMHVVQTFDVLVVLP